MNRRIESVDDNLRGLPPSYSSRFRSSAAEFMQ